MRRSLFVVVLVCTAFLVACGSTTTTGQGSGSQDQRTDGPAPGSDPAATAVSDLEFTVDAVDGSTFRGADYAGEALAIWFWAPW